MAGPWDDLMKVLLKTKPQDIVQWVWKGAIAKYQLSEELKCTLYADGLFLVEEQAHEFLLHLEFQSNAHPHMGERLHEYNLIASREHDYLPVYSCVIYLRKGINKVPSPSLRKLPMGQEISRFYFGAIELADLPAEQFFQTGPLGLLPLVPLMEGGTKQEAVDTMISRLASAQEQQLLTISYLLGGLAFEGEEAQRWFKERFDMFEEMIQDTYAYRKVIEKGIQQGVQQGIQQGVELGEIRALRQVVLDVVAQRFPEMERSAKKLVETLRTASTLHRLIIKLSKAQTPQEATVAFMLEESEDTEH